MKKLFCLIFVGLSFCVYSQQEIDLKNKTLIFDNKLANVESTNIEIYEKLSDL